MVKNITDRKRIEAEHLVLNRTQEFAILYEMTHDLGNFGDRETLFQKILERILIQLDVHSGAIYLFDADHHKFSVVAQIGPPFQIGASVPRDEWLSEAPSKTYLDSPSIVRVPIIHANECLGMLILRMMQFGGSFDKRPNLNLLALIATQVAAAIHNLDMFDQVRASHLRAQDLAKSILSTQEKERRLIARELHDEFGQELTSVQLGLQSIARSLRHSSTHTRLNDIMGIIEHVMEQMRNLSRALRPAMLDDFGLVPALEWFAEQQVKRAGLESEIIADQIQERLPEEIETVCFRVAQEAITNVLRHAHAKRIVVRISLGYEQLELVIQDDGIGFELPEAMKSVSQGHSLGLLSMQERVELIGGQMQIITAPREGTRIQVSIPIHRDSLVEEIGSRIEV
jgi:signal transduction histidine kinase